MKRKNNNSNTYIANLLGIKPLSKLIYLKKTSSSFTLLLN